MTLRRLAGVKAMSEEWPNRCVSNAHFADQFPKTLKRYKAKRLTGQVLREDGAPDCYRVKWDALKTPWSLHKSFFRVLPPA